MHIANQDSRIKEACLTLLRNCLAFDFIGTIPDESGEDIGSIQVSYRVILPSG